MPIALAINIPSIIYSQQRDFLSVIVFGEKNSMALRLLATSALFSVDFVITHISCGYLGELFSVLQ